MQGRIDSSACWFRMDHNMGTWRITIRELVKTKGLVKLQAYFEVIDEVVKLRILKIERVKKGVEDSGFEKTKREKMSTNIMTIREKRPDFSGKAKDYSLYRTKNKA